MIFSWCFHNVADESRFQIERSSDLTYFTRREKGVLQSIRESLLGDNTWEMSTAEQRVTVMDINPVTFGGWRCRITASSATTKPLLGSERLIDADDRDSLEDLGLARDLSFVAHPQTNEDNEGARRVVVTELMNGKLKKQAKRHDESM
jgi:hypothetical protein